MCLSHIDKRSASSGEARGRPAPPLSPPLPRQRHRKVELSEGYRLLSPYKLLIFKCSGRAGFSAFASLPYTYRTRKLKIARENLLVRQPQIPDAAHPLKPLVLDLIFLGIVAGAVDLDDEISVW